MILAIFGVKHAMCHETCLKVGTQTDVLQERERGDTRGEREVAETENEMRDGVWVALYALTLSVGPAMLIGDVTPRLAR